MDVKAIVALVLVGLGVLLDIVGLAIPYWRYLSIDTPFGSASNYNGLWTFCTSDPTQTNCESFAGVIRA